MNRLFLAVLTLTWLFSFEVMADRGLKDKTSGNNSQLRTALVIGNSDYQASPLTNPKNDANDPADRVIFHSCHVVF